MGKNDVNASHGIKSRLDCERADSSTCCHEEGDGEQLVHWLWNLETLNSGGVKTAFISMHVGGTWIKNLDLRWDFARESVSRPCSIGRRCKNRRRSPFCQTLTNKVTACVAPPCNGKQSSVCVHVNWLGSSKQEKTQGQTRDRSQQTFVFQTSK